jgi:hypothetical protein
MTESKNKTRQMWRYFFRLRRTKPLTNSPSTAPNIEAELPSTHPWYRPTALKSTAVVLVAMLFSGRAHGQFGLDTAALIAELSKMQSLMNTYMAKPLQTINQAEQTISKYEQDVMYPIAAINQAKSLVGQFEGQFSQIKNMFHVNISSATLPQSQGLETALLSRNVGSMTSVATQYQSVYGVVMAQNTASPAMRNMTDMTDAQAEDAMKRAIALDAISDQELTMADQMGQQIASAAPGSAPILEAEADIWVVRANAYTQSALSELMRTRGIDLANQSMLKKMGSANNTTNNNLINGSLTSK